VDKNVGSGKTVNVSGVSVTGADAGNYSFNSAATTTATILPATLTVKADNKSMTACQTTPALTVSLLGFVPGEAMITSGVSGLPSLSTSANSSVPGAYPITVTVGTLTASNYQFAFTNGTLTVLANPVPVVTITGPTAAANVFPVNVPVQFSGTWTDNAGDVHTAKWLFDGVIATDPVTVTGDPTGTGTASTSHVFTAPGVYMITLRMADPCGATGQSALVGGVDAMVVIYDPSAGFVTGGGWINSPAGAYRPDPSLSGKANFGFESKYAKGARTPTGETEFQFKVGNLNFHSTAYEWLVISGPNAQYKGTGTVNGVAGYDFMLTARDAELDGAGSNSDKFRMKIIHHATDAVVYDNQFGTPDTSAATTALGGGSIVIHQVKGGNSVPVSPASLRAGDATLESTTGLEFSMAQNAPNPFRGTTAITFTLPVKCTVKLTVFDVAGREVVTLANEERDPGQHVVTWSGNTKIGHSAERGVYFVRLSATPVTGAQGFTSLKKMALLE